MTSQDVRTGWFNVPLVLLVHSSEWPAAALALERAFTNTTDDAADCFFAAGSNCTDERAADALCHASIVPWARA